MAEYDGISSFSKAGLQRLQDAEELLEQPSVNPQQSDANTRHLRGAVYLAGYSIECVLKEYIISHTPPAESLSEALTLRMNKNKAVVDIHSAAGHNIFTLLTLTDLEAALTTDFSRKQDWGVCLRWKSSWRYSSEPLRREYADEFVAAARRTYNWIKQRV